MQLKETPLVLSYLYLFFIGYLIHVHEAKLHEVDYLLNT